MNKQDLVNAIAESLDLGKQNAEAVVSGVFAHIEAALRRGEDVKISGFGAFRRVATKPRTCRNPHTGETIDVPAGHKIKFKASSKFKE